MKYFKKKLAVLSLALSVLVLAISGVASAHVVVKPDEVVTAGFQTFVMGVPNEKDIPTTSIKLVIPAGLKSVTPTQKAGWQIDVEKEGSGADATVKSITWSGGSIPAGFRDDFTFSGQVPAQATDLQWKAYQTYSDGTVVAWDKNPPADETKDDDSITPFSVTKVVADTETDASIKKADQAAADAKDAANRAMYLGIAGIIIGLGAIYLTTRKK